MSALDDVGRQLLAYLVSQMSRIDPDDPRTYVPYGEAHSVLKLPVLGNTIGMSLRHQGLDSLTTWAMENGKPAISGLIIDSGTWQPGGGFFRAYEKEHDPDQYRWWIDQIRLVKQYDWAKELSMSSASLAKRDPSESPTGNESDPGRPERETIVVDRVIRDTALALKVKRLHGWRCQICSLTILLPDGSKYAEGHHIQPLGSPHSGPDCLGNILCVCPNHHVELDYGVIPLSIENLRRATGHAVDPRFIEYHNSQIHRRTV